MDPIRNPYTPNAGSRPPELAGRESEIKQFEVLVGRLKRGATEQRSQALTGQSHRMLELVEHSKQLLRLPGVSLAPIAMASEDPNAL